MSKDQNHSKRKPGPAEMRNLRLKNKREAVRIVRNTFIFIALLAGCWYLYLVYKDSQTNRSSESGNKQEVREEIIQENPVPDLPIEGKVNE